MNRTNSSWDDHYYYRIFGDTMSKLLHSEQDRLIEYLAALW